MHAAVLFNDVSYHLGSKTILDHLTFEVGAGNIYGLLGPNGAGKSTLLSLITGLRRHASGSITVLGERLPMKGGRLRQRIGVVLQETALYEELTTRENLQFAASLYNVREASTRLREVLALLRLTDCVDQSVRTLSGGMRRRVAIARALLHDPELLVIDEPTLGVDVEARHAIWAHLRLLKARAHTVIVATNYLDEAQALCDTAIVLRQGKVLAMEAPAALVKRTGSCLDVACDEHAGQGVSHALARMDSVLRIDQTASGISVFLKSETLPEHIMSIILQHTHIGGFRLRAPDLAEVFKTLEHDA